MIGNRLVLVCSLAVLACVALAGCDALPQDAPQPLYPSVSQAEWTLARQAAVGPRDGQKLRAIAAAAATGVPAVLAPRVLMYHDFVAAGATGEQVDEGTFKAQMLDLRRLGYHPISAEDLYQAYAGRRPLDPHAVLLTFDDSDEGQYTYAAPILKALGYQATFFALPEETGAKDHLSWPQLRALDASPLFRVYSHTNVHSFLPHLRYAQLRQALSHSRRLLEAHLGGRRDFFAYPNGAYDLPIMALVERYYKMAFAVGGDRVPGVAPQLQVPRIGIGSDVTTLAEFERRLQETRTVSPEPREMYQALTLAPLNAKGTHKVSRRVSHAAPPRKKRVRHGEPPAPRKTHAPPRKRPGHLERTPTP